MYLSKPSIIYGFHGMDEDAALPILLKKTTSNTVIIHMIGLAMVFIFGKTIMKEPFNMLLKIKQEKTRE